MKTVPDMLREAAKTYEERNRLYGDNYKKFGHVMKAIWPEGVELRTADQFNRMGIFVQIVGKVTRYAAQFGQVGGHEDSLIDLTVYAQMLRELDLEQLAARKKETTDFIAKGKYNPRDWLADIKVGEDTYVPPAPAEWIPWSGGECPVDPKAIVEYKMRTEPAGASPHKNIAADLRWSHHPSGGDIVEYRVIG